MKCSLDISNVLEEISSLSHSLLFLYLFALIAEEAEVEQFYEDLLELTPPKDILFIIGDWNANRMSGNTWQFGNARQIGSGQTGDSKSEHRQFRNQ